MKSNILIMFDIAMPNGNEDELLRIYREFGYKNVVFSYIIKKKQDISIFERYIPKYPSMNVYTMVILDNDKKLLNNILPELFYNPYLYIDLVVVHSKTFDFNRWVLNKYYHNGILNPGVIDTNDNFINRYTSLSYISIKKIKENNQAIFINFNKYIKNPLYLGRLLYLVRILNKNNVPIIIGSFSSRPEDIPKKEQLIAVKNVFSIKYPYSYVFGKFIYEQIKRTRLAKNPSIYTKGFYVSKYPYEDCREF